MVTAEKIHFLHIRSLYSVMIFFFYRIPLQMIARTLEIVFVLILSVAFSIAYVVPKARIDVLHPKGFSVSIPDTPGES